MTPAERTLILDIPVEDLKYATAQELVMYEKALQIERDLSGVYSYMEKASPSTIKPYPHTVLICSWLDALFEGRLYDDGPGPSPVAGVDEDGSPTWVHPERGDPVVWNLALHAPPRHGKSLIVSEHLPAYLLTKYPECSGILASYETEFAESWGAKVRDHIYEHSEHFGIHLEGGKNAAKGWFTLKGHKGEFKCSGAGGSIVGRGGHWLILDDPIANSEDAMSAVIRQKHEDWWHTTWYTRRMYWPDGTPARVITMFTRWHEDDLRTRIIDKQHGRWAILNIPAIAEPSDEEPVDPIGRPDGKELCARLQPLSELIDMRKSAALWFEALYQGRPTLMDGNLIKKPFQHYEVSQTEDGEELFILTFLDGKKVRVRRSQCLAFAAMDLAASVKTTADWTVLGQFLVTKTQPRYLLVRHIERTRIETDNHSPFLVRQHGVWKQQYTLIEKQTFGTNLINSFRKQNKLQIRPVNADRDKVARVQGSVLPALDMRQLFFPDPTTSWYPAFEKEIMKFNNGTHDDQVDVLAYACQEFINMPQFFTKPEEPGGMEGRVRRRIDNLKGNKRKGVLHPDLGRY
jgi:predicted phage terminase large subunit-like protein